MTADSHFATKPDDIPHSVWRQAEVGMALHERRQELIARAIMAEREACALIADGQSASIAHPAAAGTAIFIADAIRKRDG